MIAEKYTPQGGGSFFEAYEETVPSSGKSSYTEKKIWELMRKDLRAFEPRQITDDEIAKRCLYAAQHEVMIEALEGELERLKSSKNLLDISVDPELVKLQEEIETQNESAAKHRNIVVEAHLDRIIILVEGFLKKRRIADKTAQYDHPSRNNGPSLKRGYSIHANCFQQCTEKALQLVSNYKGTNGASYWTYVKSHLREELKHIYQEESMELAGMSDRQLKVSASIGRLKNQFFEVNNRWPKEEELRLYVNEHVDQLPFKQPLSVEAFLELQGHHRTVTLSSPCHTPGEDEGLTYEEILSAEDDVTPLSFLEGFQKELTIKNRLYKRLEEMLTGRQLEVIKLRFGLQSADGQGMTYREIGRALNSDHKAVERTAKRALARLEEDPEILQIYMSYF